jgi:hypothetical protein
VRELSRQIEQLILEFQQNYPNTSDAEIGQALRHVTSSAGSNQTKAVAVGLALVGMLGFFVFFFFARSGGVPFEGFEPRTMIWLVAALTAVIGIGAALFANKR